MSNSQSGDWSWPFWFLVPLYPYRRRRTLRHEIVPDTIWTFDQCQGILYTIVPVRMTVVRLESGGLLVYAPIAPTRECVRLVKELEAIHGEVKYILLPTASGLEHKVFVGPFARKFPQAQVFVAPHQWSFPVNLPLPWLGFPRDRTQELPLDSAQSPFGDEFDYAVLDINLGDGSFGEVALLHKPSQTLLLTDTILSVPAEPPAILELDPYPMLFHARESALDPMADTPENRLKGWKRIALFAVYFQPSTLQTVKLGQAIREAVKAPDHSPRAYFGLFPFQWQEDWETSFDALHANGRPFIAPILQTLILDHDLEAVKTWAERVASWDFRQIISAHFDAPIDTNPYEFAQAFAVLQHSPEEALFGSQSQPLLTADVDFIRRLEATLEQRGVVSSPDAAPSERA